MMLEMLFAIIGCLFGFVLVSFQKFGLGALGAASGCLLATVANKYVTPKLIKAFEVEEDWIPTANISVFVVLRSS